VKNIRTKLYVISFIVIGLLPFAIKPLQFGMDFTGGTIINIQLSEPVEGPEKEVLVRVLQDRLNSFGLKDMKVRPGGPDFIMVEVAETDPKVVAAIQKIIGEQGRFEAMFEGKVLLGSDGIIGVVSDPTRGYTVSRAGTGYMWSVPFTMSTSAAKQFANMVAGKCTLDPSDPSGSQCMERTYMFIDRPQNAVILLTPTEYEAEKEIPEQFNQESPSNSKIPLEELLQDSDIGLIVTGTVDQQVLDQVKNKTVILKEGSPLEEYISLLNSSASEVQVKPQTGNYFIPGAINLQSIVRLTSAVTSGEVQYDLRITGGASNEEEAIAERDRTRIILDSGKLPVSVQVSGVSSVSASLGKEFLYYSGVAGLAAILAVGMVIFFRYKKPKIVGPMLMISVSEAVMILGMAAWIGWQLDLPAVAGIIAAVGTGVDHLIIITDEAVKGASKEKRAGIASRIKKAVNIIMMAAFTTIIAMFPLFTLGLGVLKGFALTTILGSLIGVFIARPAYAEFVRRLV